MLDMRLARIELRYERHESLPPKTEQFVQVLHRWGLSTSPQEVGWVLCFSYEREIHSFIEVARGTQRRLPIHLPSLLGAVLVSGTDRFAFIHSHPGGNTTPSDADLDVTEQIANAASTCGLYFEDHIIVTNDPSKWLSMKKEGLYIPAEYNETEAARYGTA
jgi:DNA repair protein RadC